jgi:hypothetical protein
MRCPGGRVPPNSYNSGPAAARLRLAPVGEAPSGTSGSPRGVKRRGQGGSIDLEMERGTDLGHGTV